MAMAELPLTHIDSRDERKAISNVVLTSDPSVAPTTGPYRLYKRRWIGIFAMVSTTTFVPILC